ncbi:MAG: DEAD/DEAH box helicase [Polyangiales bacterium]
MPTRAAHDPPRAPATDLQDVPVEALKNVGAHAAAAMHARGIRTASDLLALLPRRYLDLRHADDWRRVRHGTPGTLVAVEGVIADLRRSGPPRARRLSIALKEPHGPTTLRAVFFHANAGLNARLALGGTVRLVGALREGRSGPELVQPRVLGSDARTRPIEPVHPGVGAVAPGNVTRVILAALEEVSRWSDPVPPEVARAMNLPSAADALRLIHAPGPSVTPDALRALAEGRSAAHRRLGFEELLALSVAMERTRRSAGGAAPFASTSAVSDDVGARLGLDLTASQRRAIDTLRGDLARPEPMRRLLVGDVGSGKTAVALAATLAVLRAGGAVAWLCPTTLVAEQHAKTLERGLAGEGGPLAVLVGSTPARAKKRAVEVISQGLVRAVVGTHALLEPGALPPRLGLVVIDEQHRFGVAQRIAMVEGRSPSPHMLVVSATPIPRTLALARHGDLDVVTLDERPAGRQPVVTKVVR